MEYMRLPTLLWAQQGIDSVFGLMVLAVLRTPYMIATITPTYQDSSELSGSKGPRQQQFECAMALWLHLVFQGA